MIKRLRIEFWWTAERICGSLWRTFDKGHGNYSLAERVIENVHVLCYRHRKQAERSALPPA